MARFRKRPKIVYPLTEVEAARLVQEHTIKTPQGMLVGKPGDWMITGKSVRAKDEGETYQIFLSNKKFVKEYMLMSDSARDAEVWDEACVEAKVESDKDN